MAPANYRYLIEDELRSLGIDGKTIAKVLDAVNLEGREAQKQVTSSKCICPEASGVYDSQRAPCNFSEVSSLQQAWQYLSKEVLRPDHPFELHQLLFKAAYQKWDTRLQVSPPMLSDIKNVVISQLDFSSHDLKYHM